MRGVAAACSGDSVDFVADDCGEKRGATEFVAVRHWFALVVLVAHVGHAVVESHHLGNEGHQRLQRLPFAILQSSPFRQPRVERTARVFGLAGNRVEFGASFVDLGRRRAASV